MTEHTDRSSAGGVRSRRPRWLLPALVAAVLAIGLVIGGILPATFVLYVFSMGAMLLMHAGGHGGHGSSRPGHDGGGQGDAAAGTAGEGRRSGGCH